MAIKRASTPASLMHNTAYLQQVLPLSSEHHTLNGHHHVALLILWRLPLLITTDLHAESPFLRPGGRYFQQYITSRRNGAPSLNEKRGVGGRVRKGGRDIETPVVVVPYRSLVKKRLVNWTVLKRHCSHNDIRRVRICDKREGQRGGSK
ncbi:hypothetical protein TRVL_00793 [Trypanosoma vivax]|uniref:Uncharacterized protein n=1 Tax=Trypanosoma vivax (strain Y486) TaxID=1055687 RepID=G0UC58_TRYVY|nr:hypothetical protein TRVL_00793 [Trypanosoma vivax]CCC53406.1 hypothetical protein, unlikely [Trypanosoma vivax Y486]